MQNLLNLLSLLKFRSPLTTGFMMTHELFGVSGKENFCWIAPAALQLMAVCQIRPSLTSKSWEYVTRLEQETTVPTPLRAASGPINPSFWLRHTSNPMMTQGGMRGEYSQVKCGTVTYSHYRREHSEPPDPLQSGPRLRRATPILRTLLKSWNSHVWGGS